MNINSIKKQFPGTLALNNVTLDIYAGEVHAIMGENGAGKSTLLNILTGSIQSYEGAISIKNKQVHFRNPGEARVSGVSIVHQELGLFSELSVMENIVAGQMPSKLGFMDKKSLLKICEEYFKKFKVNFKPSTLIRDLSVSQQQIVEIIKALVVDADIYIFDEPTSALSGDDVERLFQVMRDLKNKQKAIIYVSHKFDEIFQISDRISILRDGNLVKTGLTSDFDSETIIRLMVGRTLERIYPEKGKVKKEILFKISDLTSGEKCQDVSLELYKGEVLGVFGLVGSGRTEIMKALAGIDKKQKGRIELHGKEITIQTVQDSIRQGIYYLTEDRKQQGLFLKMTVRDNVAVTHLNKLSLIKKDSFVDTTSKVIGDLRVKTSSMSQLVGSLSGGNQQKIMIGKWLSLHPQIVILDEPTRGIDVGAKAEIHQLLRQLANEGIGVIMISSELPEIVGMSDRVVVIRKGRVVGNLAGSDINDETIMTYASGLA